MSNTIEHTQGVDRRGASSALAKARTRRNATGDCAQVPEWATERWAHRVEAEARNRLKHDLHDVGAPRR